MLYLCFHRQQPVAIYLPPNFASNTRRYDEGFSLSIQAGQGGARISHDHESQFYYALQSMMLWREVLHDMFRLWCIAEEDLLSENNPYRCAFPSALSHFGLDPVFAF